jgi:DNA-binding transcriptional regulator YhcF (GntR family)
MKGVISINADSKIPKYQQIYRSIANAVKKGVLTHNVKLPSVNEILAEYDVSRDTVVKAFDQLKERGIIVSVPGKGFYVSSVVDRSSLRILLLFNKLSAHKKIIYDAFCETIGSRGNIDFYVYNNNFEQFEKLILQKINEEYTHYVVIPHFVDKARFINDLYKKIPRHQLVVLDKKPENEYPLFSVYQDFEKDIYLALSELNDHLSRYKILNIVFPKDTYQPESILSGFKKYCIEVGLQGKVLQNISETDLHRNEAFITLMDDDLVMLIKRCKELKYKIGSEIGIISYNENILKEVLVDGITTISTDFGFLGKTAADMILNDERGHRANPFNVIIRKSL